MGREPSDLSLIKKKSQKEDSSNCQTTLIIKRCFKKEVDESIKSKYIVPSN